MKGVSEVIAIILILMIVIALAALAYTWFSGIFASLTGTAGTAVTTTAQAMNTQFIIESAKQGTPTSSDIRFYIRNTGQQSIILTSAAAYAGDAPLICTVGNGCTGNLAAGMRSSQITVNGAPTCTGCPGICMFNLKPQMLRITVGAGLETSAIVYC